MACILHALDRRSEQVLLRNVTHHSRCSEQVLGMHGFSRLTLSFIFHSNTTTRVMEQELRLTGSSAVPSYLVELRGSATKTAFTLNSYVGP
jgi:hypothetical protein